MNGNGKWRSVATNQLALTSVYINFRGTFSEKNRLASLNLSGTYSALASTWPPGCTTKEKEPLLIECVNTKKMVCKFPLNGICGYDCVPPKMSYFGMTAMPFLCNGRLQNQFNISRDNLLWTLNWQKCPIIMLVFHSPISIFF